MFPYTEKWKDMFEWAEHSTCGEQYTYCRYCDRNLSTFHKGLSELSRHGATNKHKKRAQTPKRQVSEPLPCSDLAIQFIYKHCYAGSVKGEMVSRHFARCKLGLHFPKDIQSVCQQTPYSIYIYGGVTLEKDDTVSVVLVGFFDVESSRHCIRVLDAFRSEGDAGSQAAEVVEILKKFRLPKQNLVAVYSEGNSYSSGQICFHLKELNPNIVALGGLYAVADAACHVGVKELSRVQELIADIHDHYSSCSNKNSNLTALFDSGISANSPSFNVNTSCLTFTSFLKQMLEMWTDLIQYFKSCNKNDNKAKLICSQLQDSKVRATYMFLEQALKPLQSFQRHLETQEGTARADIQLILEEASSLLCTYTSFFLRPQAALRFLKEHDNQILKNEKFHLPSSDLNVGGKTVEDFLNESESMDIMPFLKQEVLPFYIALIGCIAKDLPLQEGVLKSMAQLLNPQGSFKVTGKAVRELGTKLGICSSAEEVNQLMSEFQEYQAGGEAESEEDGKDSSQVVSLEEHWASALKDVEPASVFRKLLLTLLALPCPPLEPKLIFTKVNKWSIRSCIV